MPFLDYFRDKLRKIKRDNSNRQSLRGGTLKRTGSSVGGATGGAASASASASAPLQTPQYQMPQPEFPRDDDSIDNIPSMDRSKYNTLPYRRSGSTLQRQNTMNAGTGGIDSSRNFWDIRGYKNTLNRCEDGHELGTKLVNCLLDRARLEEEYARSLKNWKKKWSEYLDANEREYGTGKSAWLSMLQTGENVAMIHVDLSEKIQKLPVTKLKTWLKEKYQKYMLTFKQVKEFEADFETAQKSWQKTYEKMRQRRKEYHDFCKKERQALVKSETTRANIDKTKEQKDKAEREYTTAKYETERACKSYIDEIEKLKLYRPTYEKEMKTVFKKTDQFEETRKTKFEEILRDTHQLLAEQVQSKNYKDIFDNYMSDLDLIKHHDDLKWWADTYGEGMELIMPEFEEYFG